MAKTEDGKKLIILKAENQPSEIFDDFEGERNILCGREFKVSPLNHKNSKSLRKWFPFTAPVSFGKEGMSMGLGDRLGLASPGHLRLIKDRGVKPVLAQQSIRELNLTQRTYEDVLDAASWAVFQEGYEKGFAADGDHLKTEEDIKKALDLGFTMITLDCSEKIKNEAFNMAKDKIEEEYGKLPQELRKRFEGEYLNKEFSLGEFTVSFNKKDLQRIALIYVDALIFIKDIYFRVIKPAGRNIDFEVSIDETVTPTTPEAHFFVASELMKMQVEVTSLAPKFCGEFQKGIDYIGDIDRFGKEFKLHAAIADHFGYRLSIHSGSDKFKVFPIIGRYTKGRVHVKTAGTNWLETLKVIAMKKPALFRKMYEFAIENFDEARKYYHVTTDLNRAQKIGDISDEKLVKVFTHDDARQILHITYGLILTSKDENGNYLFRDEIYSTLNSFEDEYYNALEEHIGKHLKLLGVL